ncbi:hypothetical protein MUK42_00717, partial [Musa troglodytarum]
TKHGLRQVGCCLNRARTNSFDSVHAPCERGVFRCKLSCPAPPPPCWKRYSIFVSTSAFRHGWTW